ncbi:PRC-barrel domain-containing protein [Heliorestis acidaminivorans]|nr:PRC-barrel domain-containing protein [Heliorestis acidaminivorans]
MINSKSLPGISVISIDDGKEIGFVRDLLINPEKIEIEGLLIEPEDWYYGAKILHFDAIQGIGEYAAIIEDANILQSLQERPDLVKWIEKKVHLIGSRVLTSNGVLIGQVKEFFINSAGKIMAIVIEPLDKALGERLISIEQIVKMGRQILLVDKNLQVQELPIYDEKVIPKAELTEETASDHIVREKKIETEERVPSPPIIESKVVQPEKVALLPEKSLPKEPTKPLNFKVAQAYKKKENSEKSDFLPLLQVLEEESALLNGNGQASFQDSKEPSGQKQETEAEPVGPLFGELQHKYYIGKKVTKRIESNIGQVLAEPGDVITEDLISKVKKAGKYLEMIIHVRA